MVYRWGEEGTHNDRPLSPLQLKFMKATSGNWPHGEENDCIQMWYITEHQRKTERTISVTSPPVRPAVCRDRYILPAKSNKDREKYTGNTRKASVLDEIKGVNVIDPSQILQKFISIWYIYVYILVFYTLYFMFGFHIINYFPHTIDELFKKRRGVARGECILEKFIELLEKIILPWVCCYALALPGNNCIYVG